MKQSRFTFQEVTMTNNILLTLIALSLIGFLASCLATAKTFPIPTVTVESELIEIEFVPTANVAVPTDEIEISFVAVK